MSWLTNVGEWWQPERWWSLAQPKIDDAMIVIGVLVVVAAIARVVSRRVALGGRTAARVILPSPEFEPSEEEVVRAAAVLGRVHRVTRGPWSREAFGVRIKWTVGDDGLVRYEMHGHRRAVSGGGR